MPLDVFLLGDLFQLFIKNIELYSSQAPVLFYGASAFYFCLAIILISSKWRKKISHLFNLHSLSTSSFIEPIDSFRGLAALWVASFHTWYWFQASNAGMLSFFPIAQGIKAPLIFVVLSGFLIYKSIRGKLLSSDHIRSYIKRRFFRIYPLYFVTVIALLLGGYFTQDVFLFRKFLTEIFMLKSFGYPRFINPPAWTLYVEVFFYLWLPIFVIVFQRRILMASIIALLIFSLSEATREFDLIKYFLLE